MNNNQTSQKISNKTKIIAVSIAVIAVAIIAIFTLKPSTSDNEKADNKTVAVTKDSDLVIPVSDVTEKVTFYPVEMNGTKMEVMAVKASDGTIRTAFNTCQVCYSSGKGYYEQEGDELVCQNCGNRFGMDDVEVTRGGCNPVPITSEYKTEDASNITITKDLFTMAESIFTNWK